MLKQIRNFVRLFHIPTVEDRENAYLNGANDRFDLEYRQRQVDRGLFRRAF